MPHCACKWAYSSLFVCVCVFAMRISATAFNQVLKFLVLHCTVVKVGIFVCLHVSLQCSANM